MLTNELIHSVKSDGRSALIFKLDFRKVYDSVSWEYLDAVQERMGFGLKWRKCISECISSARLAVLVNGSPTEDFPMEKGLRQGGPFIPFSIHNCSRTVKTNR
ncbi:hypothetical protein QQ045_019513 [Rhodiola kirilowii]